MALSSVGMPTNRSTSSDSPSLNRVPPPGSPLLLVSTDPESDVEVGMVPARFSLRPRTAGPRTGRREGFVRTPRYRQDQPHRAQRHFSNQPRRVRPASQWEELLRRLFSAIFTISVAPLEHSCSKGATEIVK